MSRTRTALILITITASIVIASAQASVESAFKLFWDAKNPNDAGKAVNAVVSSGVKFDEALARLKKGRTYAAGVPTGVVSLSRKTPEAEFAYTLDVPPAYDPSRKYQVRFQLHGGIGRPDPAVRGNGSIGSLAGVEQIYVLPLSWAEAPWWGDLQLANLRAILDSVKRTYNVDENRVVLSGVSDGGTGTYYLAMRDTTQYASFLPLNGFMMILQNPSLGLHEELFPNNLLNKPFFVVNGGQDPLYPTAIVEPYVKHLEKGGVTMSYHPQPNAVHNTAWWPDVKDTYETFVSSHPRDPHPATLTWEAEAGMATRAHWLVIDSIAQESRNDAPLKDLNDFEAGAEPNFGVRAAGMHVTTVLPGTNAEAFGLKSGDLILGINGRTLPDALNLLQFLSIFEGGEKLTLSVSREGKTIELAGVYKPEVITRLVPLFGRPRSWGRVDLVRNGNTVTATTRGVSAFTLLASPDVFDFSAPITVVANGRQVFSGRVQKSVPTLMKWAAIDNDRTMLYGAEIHVKVP